MKQPKPNKEKMNSVAKDTEFKKFDKTSNKFSKFQRCPKSKQGKELEDRAPKHNDPAWYTKYKTLSDNAARIAFNHRNGSKIQFVYGTNTVNTNIDPILVVEYVPTPGLSKSKASGINVAANAAYKVLNRKYRGSASGRYQTSDLGISQFAIMDFYLSLAQAERIYGLCQEARVNQRQVPRELVFALGYDYDDISGNLSDFRAKLNALIVRAQVLCLVKGYPFMDHHLFLLSNIFKDKDTDRANYFAYKKPGYWLWEPTSFTTGSAVHWIQNRSSHYFQITGPGYLYGLQTADDVIYNLDTQLRALISDSDIDLICADILALFENQGDNNLLKLTFLPDGYIVDPIFAAEALYQLHNTVVVNECVPGSSGNAGYPDADDVGSRYATEYPVSLIPTGDSAGNHKGLFVYQIDDTISFNVVASHGTLTQSQSGITIVYGRTSNDNGRSVYYPIIDTDVLNPTPDEVIEMTRQTSSWESTSFVDSGTTYYRNTARALGTVLPTNFRVFKFGSIGDYTESSGTFTFNNFTLVNLCTVTAPTNLAPLFKFDWAPIISYSAEIFADLDNYRGIESVILEVIHEAAVLSEFHNPISDILVKDV